MHMLFEKIEQLEKKNKLLTFRVRLYRLLFMIVVGYVAINKLL